MTEFLEFYVRFFAVVLPVIAVSIFSIGAARAQISAFKTTLIVALAAVLLGLWYASAMSMSEVGGFRVPPTLRDTPYVLGYLFGGAFLIWALGWLTSLGRRVTLATPLSALAAFQIPRAMGAIFLVAWVVGMMPAAFAIPAGLGDVWAGIAGWQASQALANGAPNARKLLIRANMIGIADLVIAVILGILTSRGFAHVLSQDLPNIINDHPLSMFPAFFVPIFLGFHLITLSRMQAGRSVTQLS